MSYYCHKGFPQKLKKGYTELNVSKSTDKLYKTGVKSTGTSMHINASDGRPSCACSSKPHQNPIKITTHPISPSKSEPQEMVGHVEDVMVICSVN